jgi:hypothetical protein
MEITTATTATTSEISDLTEHWRSTYRLVCTYMDEQQKPQESNINPDVKKLAAWISCQKRHYAKNEGNNPAICADSL